MDKLFDLLKKEQTTKEKSQVKVIYDLNNNDYHNFGHEQIRLDCGATLVNTPAGYIQFGIPPGCLSELISKKLQVPIYFIVPSVRFHKKYAVNLCDFIYVAFYNYLKGKKTYLICNPLTPMHLRQIFKEMWPQWDDSVIHKDIDFYSSIDKNPIPNFQAEFKYLRNMLSQYNQEMPFEDMIDFIVIDKKTGCEIGDQIHIKRRGEEIAINVNDIEVASLQDKVDINYVEEVNWDDILKKKYDINDVLRKSQMAQTVKNQSLNLDTSKHFAITFLPKLNKDELEEESNGFIIWINGRGLLVDPPVFTSQILTKMHISSSVIEWIIITQGSSRSDLGAFQLMFQNSKIELITTRQIYDSFLKKYSDLSNMPADFLNRILKFRPISIGAPLVVKTCKFKFFYTLNVIPSLGFEAQVENQQLYYGGDTILTKSVLEDMKQKGVINQDRYNQILNKSKWKNSQLRMFYVGEHPWHTQIEDFLNMEDFKDPHQRHKTLLFTKSPSVLKKIVGAGFATPSSIGYGVDINLYDKKQSKIKSSDVENMKKMELQKKIDLLCTIEIFESISIKNFRDLLQSAKEEYYDPGEYVIRQGTIGTKFYFVMSGIVCIFDDARSLSRFCPTGSYFGETALKVDSTRRGANVIAVTPCELLSLEKQDFFFIFGEEKDESAPIIQKLLSMYTSRRKNTVNLLKKNEIFKELNEQQKTEMEMIFREAKFETNKLIWTKGEEARFAIFIKEGSIKFSDCEEQKNPEMGEGFFIGEIDSLVNDKPLTTTLISLKPTEVFIVDKNDLVSFFKKNLGILLKLNYLKYFK
ncbi:cyclic nucleotide-binding domain protein (macronuclear) [Tetrahymena thermophila SB210]|uniref:Cyclic nucleotide-binding domain protein n=1 Tax=Tetrahymena thermophila (strain SB210) TaxID=312017 RepID=Q23DN4_TETTS|nr:cyclic nucleotide-binding domain protein [Tetrahymena thermophila SB210]EAR94504.2 cyclic nucleotide-binding domain protein [Tetrahymena thermophila SB210]|eukprot:XP_001014652.2 cyclic nucleotide-binding domain protein [Tetrahymena thermophila SB210]